MAPKPWPIIVDGIVGDIPANFYPAMDSEKKMVLHGTPGLLSLCKLANCSEVRGLYAWDNYLYAVARRGSQAAFYRVNTNGTYAELGVIPTSAGGPVFIVNNVTQMLIVDGVTGYVFTPASGSFLPITDTNFPGALACSYQDTYGLFVQPNTQNWFFSYPNDFTKYNSLDVYAKEGSTDNVKGILSNNVGVYVFGEKTMEPWYDAGGDNSAASSPTFARNEGGVFQYGLGASATPCNFDNTPIWLSDQGQIIRFSGNVPQVISTDLVGRAIARMASFSDATAFSYIHKEHTFYQINFSVGNMTLVYDAKTQLFHKRLSYIDGSPEFGRHRANCYAEIGGKHYVGDYSNGTIYEMSDDYYDDDGHEMLAILYAAEIDGGMTRIFFPDWQLLMKMGVGPTSGLDPQVMTQYSNDHGNTWSNERWASIGKIGEYGRRAILRRNGSDYRRLYRIMITDPVPRTILALDSGGL